MLCDNSLLCPRTLFSSPMGSWLGSPQPREATQLSLSNLLRYLRSIDWAQIIQSRLCCLLDTTSTRPASTCTSAAASGYSIPRRRSRSGDTLLVSTKRTADFHSQVNCTSKIVLAKRFFWLSLVSQLKMCQQVHLSLSLASQLNSQDVLTKCTSDFHSQVNCTSRIVIAKHDLGLSLTGHNERAIQVHTQEHATQVHGWVHFKSQLTADFIPFGTGSPLWHISFRGAVLSLVWALYCHFTTGSVRRTPTVGWICWWQYLLRYCHLSFWTGSHSTICYLFVAQVPALLNSSLQTDATY